MKHRILGATAFAFLTSYAWAQPPTPPLPAQMVSNQVARLTAVLSLTTAQQMQATTIFTAAQDAMAPIRTNMDTEHTALQAAIAKNDTAAIGSLALQIGTLTGQQVQLQASAQAAFNAILTSDQATKASQLHALGIGGPGGPHGPGGPGH